MNKLIPLLEKTSDVTVLCVGDIMLDRFIYGEVERISPEAPIPVLKISHEKQMLGGAGNVVRNISSLGANAIFCGVVGKDTTARTIDHLMGETQNCQANFLSIEGRVTPEKTRFMAVHQQMLRTDNETTEAVSGEFTGEFLALVEEKMPLSDVFVLSDYGKGLLTREMCQKLIHMAQSHKLKIIVDPKGEDYQKYKGASLITPNRKELIDASGLPCSDNETIKAAAQKIIETCKIDQVLATRSQDGMSLISQGQDPLHLPTEAREVFDVSGAGDTVVAAMAVAMATDENVEIAAKLANCAAGLVVAKSGTATVSSAEIIEHIQSLDLQKSHAKVMGRVDAEDLVQTWKNNKLSVGFTNGCFDLLHPGHISLLQQSSAQCDVLIVGLNSDASIKRLKGEERPIQSEMARATVLSSLECVDLVVLFEEDTPMALLELFLPDVLVKGADYTIETVVGADLIQDNGGRVHLAELKDGFSTTNTVRKIKKTGP